MKIGIICPSEIALRRFMPALTTINELEFVGLGVCSAIERFGEDLPNAEVIKNVISLEKSKAQVFVDTYGGKIFNSYSEVVQSDEIEAVYIPLPPALHYKWAKSALEHGKHVLVEKPATIALEDTKNLVDLAKNCNLALHENYMFNFHSQLDEIEEIVASGELGDVRLSRIYFGFPKRAANDFRYNAVLGGGALIDAGGYTLKYADRLLRGKARIRYAQMNYCKGCEVDIYGSGAMSNPEGDTVQISFGMDNNYKCELEIWGSKGCLTTGRVLTAPVGFTPEIVIRKGNIDEKRTLSSDDSFRKSILYFMECINSKQTRNLSYESIYRQAKLVDQFKKMAVDSI